MSNINNQTLTVSDTWNFKDENISYSNEIIKGSQSQKKQACVIFERNVVDGIYDITNESPFYEELESLVMIVN